MRQQGITEAVISIEDLIELGQDTASVVVQELEDGLHVKLVTMEEGKRLAREHGGLPS